MSPEDFESKQTTLVELLKRTENEILSLRKSYALHVCPVQYGDIVEVVNEDGTHFIGKIDHLDFTTEKIELTGPIPDSKVTWSASGKKYRKDGALGKRNFNIHGFKSEFKNSKWLQRPYDIWLGRSA